MISADAVSNVLAYSAQLTAIVAAAWLLSVVIRIDAASVRYAYWRAVGALCLALPWLQRAHRPADDAAPFSANVVTAIATAVGPAAVSPGPHVDWVAVAIGVAVFGAIARLIWVIAGLVTLHRLRARCDTTFAYGSDLQETLGTHADVRCVPALAQPVTFGLRRPVVLLPAHLREQSPEIQRAVLGHELLHVQRRDWAWLVAEEIVRAALWFHPAAWWLISRIQLAREEAVDELTVMLTGHRKIYIEALLAFADSTSLTPTAAFARRRHLFRRITLVSKEAVMSSRRIVTSCAALALVLVAGSWYAVSAFPLRQSGALSTAPAAAGTLERKSVPITPENPIPRRVSFEPLLYPAEAAAMDLSGHVTLTVTLDELGRVAEVRPAGYSFFAPGLKLNGVSLSGRVAISGTGAPDTSSGTGADASRALDAVTRAATDAVKQWRYDPPFKAPISFPVTLNFGTPPPPPPPPPPPAAARARRTPGIDAGAPPPPPPPPPAGAAAGQAYSMEDGAVRIGGEIKSPVKVKDVRPVYPPIAQEARVQGVVIIEARVEADGHVGATRILRSIPLLDEAALDAVRQWQFTPTLMNGVPTPVVMTLTVNFTLQ